MSTSIRRTENAVSTWKSFQKSLTLYSAFSCYLSELKHCYINGLRRTGKACCLQLAKGNRGVISASISHWTCCPRVTSVFFRAEGLLRYAMSATGHSAAVCGAQLRMRPGSVWLRRERLRQGQGVRSVPKKTVRKDALNEKIFVSRCRDSFICFRHVCCLCQKSSCPSKRISNTSRNRNSSMISDTS